MIRKFGSLRIDIDNLVGYYCYNTELKLLLKTSGQNGLPIITEVNLYIINSKPVTDELDAALKIKTE